MCQRQTTAMLVCVTLSPEGSDQASQTTSVVTGDLRRPFCSALGSARSQLDPVSTVTGKHTHSYITVKTTLKTVSQYTWFPF